MPLKQDGDRHGFQARAGRREKLAPSRRSQPVAKAHHRRKVHRRHPSPQPTAASRLTPDRHQHSAIAPSDRQFGSRAESQRERRMVLSGMLVPVSSFQNAGRKTTPSSGSPVVTKRQSAMISL